MASIEGIDQIQAALTSLNLAKHRLEKERILLDEQTKKMDMAISALEAITIKPAPNQENALDPYIPELGPFSNMKSQDAVWAVLDRANRSVTVREVIETLNSGGIDMEQRYSSPYNSVYTALKRLVGKGKVEEDLLPDGDKRYHVARNFHENGRPKSIEEVVG